MSVTWTKEQQQVLDLRGRSLLVSAAAGSGKTAVLVQRIIGMVTDPIHPIDIDRLLVMTFTRAAAGEMKDRLQKALEKEVLAHPQDEHLLRQLNLIHAAQITTIDGFCAWLLKNYFHLIDLDPGFRIAEEGECRLLRADVMQELLEEHYADPDPRFTEFMETAAPGKSDEEAVRLILRLYDASMSNPYPEQWLAGCARRYDPENLENFLQSDSLWDSVREDLEDALSLAREARALCEKPDGPFAYQEAVTDDLLLIQALQKKAAARDYDGMWELLDGLSFTALSKKRMPDCDPDLKERFKKLREEEKAVLKSLAEKSFTGSRQQQLNALERTAPMIRELTELTAEFSRRFSQAKRKKNILDFGDLEHLALEVLTAKPSEDSRDSFPGADEQLKAEWMTQAAKELSLRYEEILIDEYQDSNMVQEYIARAVSGWAKNKENIFMVGDVKQSIYRFRLARPELFVGKYRTYTSQDGPRQKIDLHKNFRSRSQVLDAVNYIFRQIMGEDLGDIAYDDAAALYPGASFPPYPPQVTETGAHVAELLILESKDKEDLEGEDGDESLAALSAREKEAAAVAQRISQMVGRELVYDSTSGEYRPIRYGDIAILFRSAAGWAETFTKVFAKRHIPCYTASRTGYFSAPEVVAVLNLLQICDNPRQDIPLAAVLRSPTAGLSSDEMAVIRAACPEGCLYDSVQAFICKYGAGEGGSVCGEKPQGDPDVPPNPSNMMDETPDVSVEAADVPEEAPGVPEAGTGRRREIMGEETGIRQDSDGGSHVHTDEERIARRLMSFMTRLDEWRSLAEYTPIHELLQILLTQTGYELYAGALPDGAQRTANLRMLVEQAREYEKTSYHGLFSFVRYIRQLHKYEVDYGEVNLASEEGDMVQIMTVHKSKGLEFPVVFVCGMGKAFNLRDLNEAVLMHPDLGIGADAVDPVLRLRHSSLSRELIRRKLLSETLGEELRILYVALTRAKEKLILAGSVPDMEKVLQKLARLRMRDTELLPVRDRMGARTAWDLVLPALACHRCMDGLFHDAGMFPDRKTLRREGTDMPVDLYTDPAEFRVQIVSLSGLVMEEVREQAGLDVDREILGRICTDPLREAEMMIREQIRKRFEAGYRWTYLRSLPEKVSVSELKKMSWHNDEEPAYDLYPAAGADEPEPKPAFLREEEARLSGADRGTAYHRLMECLVYPRDGHWPDTENEIVHELENQVALLLNQKKMTQPQADCLQYGDFCIFLASPIGRRMSDAASRGTLRRESPFVFSRPAREIDPAWDYDERILIQGIIDAWFLEGEEIVLVDYKTDRVSPGQEQKLIDLYQVQLEDYADALQRLTGRRVKEKYIYSFALGKEILLR